jgi:hypothetical protein
MSWTCKGKTYNALRRSYASKSRQRRPLDQMVAGSRKAIASAHLTEDGYVRHRMVELRKLASRAPLTAA